MSCNCFRSWLWRHVQPQANHSTPTVLPYSVGIISGQSKFPKINRRFMAELFRRFSEIFKAMLEHYPSLPRPIYAFDRDSWTTPFVVRGKITQHVPGLVLLTLLFVTYANLIIESMFGWEQINDNTQQCVFKIIIFVKYGRSNGNKCIALLGLNRIKSVECSSLRKTVFQPANFG